MPRHKQVTTCRKTGGPVSDRCSCEHCMLAVCSVCGAYEGGLTTDCPGAKVSFDRQQEVYETNLDYTDDRGWHQGASMKNRSPRFEPESVIHAPILAPLRHESLPPPAESYSATYARIAGCTCGWRTPSSATDSDTAFARHVTETKLIQRRIPGETSSSSSREALFLRDPDAAARVAEDNQRLLDLIRKRPAHDARGGARATDWAAIDRTADLQRELAQKAIAWVLADRVAEDRTASYGRVQDEIRTHMRGKQEPDDRGRELLAKLEQEKKDFHLADERAQERDDEFRQAARKLVAELEKACPIGDPECPE